MSAAPRKIGKPATDPDPNTWELATPQALPFVP